MRKYGFYHRYHTDAELAALNRLWKLVNDRFNYLTPTVKPIGYSSTGDGRRRRLYDEPTTRLDRLLAAKVLSPAQESELLAYRDSLNPVAIGRQIADLQAQEQSSRAHPGLAGISYVMHGSCFAGILT